MSNEVERQCFNIANNRRDDAISVLDQARALADWVASGDKKSTPAQREAALYRANNEEPDRKTAADILATAKKIVADEVKVAPAKVKK